MRKHVGQHPGLYLVVSIAVIAAAVVAVLGLRTQPDQYPGAPPAATQVNISTAPISRRVPPGFLGLSLEYTTVAAYTGDDPDHVNPVLLSLIGQLTPGQDPVLRIGGDSTDWSWYPAEGVTEPPGIRITLTPSRLRMLRALQAATHAHLIMGLNLEANDRRLTAAEARGFLSDLGRGAIEAFELGNEPEVYGAIAWYEQHGVQIRARASSYGYRDYVREFTRFTRVVPRDVPLAGPASGGPRWWAQTANFLRSEPRVRVVTFHLYPLHRCFIARASQAFPTIRHLLTPFATTELAGIIAPYIPVAHRAGAQLRVDELNSVSCGGKRGVSDRYASALWILATLLDLAQAGVDGVNIHTATQTIYRPFAFKHVNGQWSASVEPDYYGLLAFARALPPGSRLVRVSAPAGLGVSIWGIRTPDGQPRAVVINDSPSRGRTIALRADKSTSDHARMQRLTGPGLDAGSGVSLAGQRFPPGTTTGLPAGRLRVAQLSADRYGFFSFRVPPATAAIVDIGGSG